VPGPTGATGPTGAGTTGATGPIGATGPEGIVAQTTAPVNTDVLWLDTDEPASTTGLVPTGGTAGQVLSKINSTDYNTQWSSISVDLTTVGLNQNAPASSIETMNKMYVTVSTANANGTVWLTMFTPLFNNTITNLVIHTAAVSSPSYTLAKLGLFSISGTNVTLVAETDNDTTIMSTANTVYTRALSSTRGYPTSYNLVAGTRYAFGIITVGTGSSNIWTNTQLSNSTLSFTVPYTAGRIQTQTDLPTAATAFIAQNLSFFARLS
jgi:hypothetical protein